MPTASTRESPLLQEYTNPLLLQVGNENILYLL